MLYLSVIAVWQCNQAAIATIVSGSMMIEALLNFVAREKLSRFQRRAIDGLPLPEKLVILNRLVYESGIVESDHTIEHVKNLAKQRNRLVHFKPKRFTYAEWKTPGESNYHFGVREAAKALSACCLVASALGKVDYGIADRYRSSAQWVRFDGIPLRDLLHESAASYLEQTEQKGDQILASAEIQALSKKWFWCRPVSDKY